ncbi:hypothetical protein VSDG_08913 [Cytospora chrysosperma]|uniref:Uncharacterized protein n=1 Tax=Cytospora chrysosperma TaxID=252740 RepID=A0A423VD79_CYTCH|nr:hypothetical protein VSDG_08913 [Valsa sordida]
MPAGSGSGSGSGAGNGGGAPDPCGTTTQYSIALVTVGSQNTQTVTQSVTITVPPGSSSSSFSSSSGVSRSAATSSATTSLPVASSGVTSSMGSSSQPSTTLPSTSVSTTQTTHVPSPTFWLRASNVTATSGNSTNANLARSNDEYARLFAVTPADSQGSQNLDFALASSASANVFTLDGQSRLVEVNLGLVATSQYGTAQKVYFDPVGNYLSGYAPIACSVQAASGSAAYATLQCVGSGSTTGSQTLTAVCFGSSSASTNGANGKLFMASTLGTVPSDCRSVTLNVVPYFVPI